MSKGAVKWFDPQKGFGFIALDSGGQDAFIHSSAVERASIAQLREGNRVAFELVSHHGGNISAEKLEILS